jgi:uracil-DNA glycosylase family 4
MTDSFNAENFSITALQLTWLRELGVDKPWLPASTALPATKTSASPAQPEIPVTRQQLANTAEQRTALNRSTVKQPIKVQTRSESTFDASSAGGTQTEVANFADLDELALSVARCENCGLCRERERPVVGNGLSTPRVMVIGESPSEQDDRQGKAFVGRSGQLLGNMLKAIGEDIGGDVYLTNAIKCRPAGNRNPRDEEIRACRPFLFRQIELLNPRALFLLGRFAVSAVLGDSEDWQKLRGQSLEYFNAGGRRIPVIVSFHPAYLLTRPEVKRLAWEDLLSLRALLDRSHEH